MFLVLKILANLSRTFPLATLSISVASVWRLRLCIGTDLFISTTLCQLPVFGDCDCVLEQICLYLQPFVSCQCLEIATVYWNTFVYVYNPLYLGILQSFSASSIHKTEFNISGVQERLKTYDLRK